MSSVHTAWADYYSDTKKGYWWYEKSPVQREEEKAETEQPEKNKKKQKQEFKDYTFDQIWDMHPDQFQGFAEEVKKQAVQRPTVENVKNYYEVQEIARKKALAFTNVAQYVWQKYPELTTKKDYPITTPGNLSRVAQISDERQRKLQENRNEFAMVYFSQPGCSYCVEQSKIIEWFSKTTQWQVKEVNILENPTLAAKFNIETTPTIILIQKGKLDYFPVSAGVISADEVEDKTYRAVRLLKGEITPEEYSLYDFQRGGGYDVNKRK